MAQTIGVVLAGGEGRRMGRPKGDLLVNGALLAERAARALRPLCGNVVISVAHGAKNPAPSYPAVEDLPPAGRGPLAGILAAFETTGRADLLVVACDYPEVGTDFLRVLVRAAREEDDVVVPVDGTGRDHPLVAFWRRRSEAAVREALEAGHYKVQSLLAILEVRRLSGSALGSFDTTRVLRNVNWPSDLEAPDGPF